MDNSRNGLQNRHLKFKSQQTLHFYMEIIQTVSVQNENNSCTLTFHYNTQINNLILALNLDNIHPKGSIEL